MSLKELNWVTFFAEVQPYIPPPPNYIEYTTVGTYTFTVPARVLRITAILVGGGGGGGAGYTSDTDTYAGGGGGGGETVLAWYPVSPGQSLSITVGAGGAGGTGGGTATPAAGADGGDSSIGTDIVAAGGKGGRPGSSAGNGAGGAGGAGTTINKYKQGGFIGDAGDGPVNTPGGGDSGGRLGLGAPATAWGAAAADGGLYGGGGGGGSYNTNGGAGANGKVIIMW